MIARFALFLFVLCGLAGFVIAQESGVGVNGPGSTAWLKAEPGAQYGWPRDHASHAGFKTEWWYFTGNLRAADGRRFGYQLTFFRQGVRHPNEPAVKSRFVANELKFGHFTLTDVRAKEFHFAQQLTRGAFGEAGFGDGTKEPRLAWLVDWSLRLETDGSFRIAARDGDRALELHLTSSKPWALHGDGGYSRKAEAPGHASHYYSGTRLVSRGTVAVGGNSFQVDGESWFDHEWATNQLTPEQAGWDWFSLQLNDGTELMLYRLRRKDGSVDAASSGSFIERDGTVRHILGSEIEVEPTNRWRSGKTGADYPIAWKVRVPTMGLELAVSTPVEHQELVLQPVTYWEGLVDISGKRGENEVRGHGYVELTGYSGSVVGLSAPAMSD